MNLGDALRDTFSQEADMQTSTPPDVDALIHGGRVRRRRRNMTRIGLTAAMVVLAGGVAYGVSQIDPGGPRSDPGTANQPNPSRPSPRRTRRRSRTETVLRSRAGHVPGASWARPTGAAIEADLTIRGTGWESGDVPVV